MTTSQLKLYNAALLEVGESELSGLTENRPPRHHLDTAWDSGNIRTRWLEQGLWNFAMKSVALNYNAALSPPDFGYSYVFDKPDDWVRTARVCLDERFSVPLQDYDDEAGYLFADIEVLYFSYVSNDASYGLDYAKWTEKFVRFCELDLARRIMHRSTGLDAVRKREIMNDWKQARADARSLDAMNEPSKQLPQGSWIQSRTASRTGQHSWPR